MKRLFAVLLLVVPLISLAQNESGIIRLSNGRLLDGQIELNGSVDDFKSFKFRRSESEPNKEFTSREVISLSLRGKGYFESTYFNSRIDTVDASFARVLVSGFASLYIYKEKFYVWKRDQPQGLILQEESYKEALDQYLTQCSTLDLGSVRWNENSLIQVVQDYNACKGYEGYVFAKSRTNTKKWIGLGVGFNQIGLSVTSGPRRFPNLENVGFAPSNSFVIGLSYMGSLSRKNPKLNYKAGVSYSSYSFSGTAINGFSYFETEIEYSQFRLNLGLDYQMSYAKLSPVIGLGFFAGSILNPKSSSYWERESQRIIRSSNEEGFEFGNSEYGFYANAGLSYSLKENIAVRFDLVAEYGTGISGEDIESNTMGISGIVKLNYLLSSK